MGVLFQVVDVDTAVESQAFVWLNSPGKGRYSRRSHVRLSGSSFSPSGLTGGSTRLQHALDVGRDERHHQGPPPHYFIYFFIFIVFLLLHPLK